MYMTELFIYKKIFRSLSSDTVFEYLKICIVNNKAIGGIEICRFELYQ